MRFCTLVLLAAGAAASAGDWPTSRYDNARAAASPHGLADDLKAHWALKLPPLKPAWPDQAMMQFDSAYEPIVAGDTLLLPSSRTDSVTAHDVATGKVKWRFVANGPVRFAPTVWDDKVYFVSDDGHLYCLKLADGALLWQFRGGPADRYVLGNGRLISTWPARGAPVVADGTVYFAASIWPFMGIFVHAVDAKTGKTVWVNDSEGSAYIKQPHSADSFAGVAPQGVFALAGDRILIPGGRSVPACYDRRTGKQSHFLLNENSKKGGGSTVVVSSKVFFNGGGAFDLASGKFAGSAPDTVALTRDAMFGLDDDELKAISLVQTPADEVPAPPPVPEKRPDEKAEPKKPAKREEDEEKPKAKPSKTGRWRTPDLGWATLPGGGTCFIKAGERLYVGTKGKVLAVALPLPPDGGKAEVVWSADVSGTPVHLAAAADRLFVGTLDGTVHCFGRGPAPDAKAEPDYPTSMIDAADAARAHLIVEETRVTDGYAVSWGVIPSDLVAELVARTNLHVVVVEPDADKARAARTYFLRRGLYGERVAVLHVDPTRVQLPQYFASLALVHDPAEAGFASTRDFLATAYPVLRPYGGQLVLSPKIPAVSSMTDTAAALKLPKAVVRASDAGPIVIREGALPGAANWTHEHGNASNTRVSPDKVVKAPLGLLWFGGTSNESILPRHGHGPQPQVFDGRIFIEGVDLLRAVDVYTGRKLWETDLPGLGSIFNNTAHQPGANASGTNYVATADGVYVAYKGSCRLLDLDTGKALKEFALPAADGRESPRWGYLNVVDDFLIGGADPLADPALLKPESSVGKLFKAGDPDNFAASKSLAVMDRHTGKVLWTAEARHGFRHNGVCAGGGRLYAVDRLSGGSCRKMKKAKEDFKHEPRADRLRPEDRHGAVGRRDGGVRHVAELLGQARRGGRSRPGGPRHAVGRAEGDAGVQGGHGQGVVVQQGLPRAGHDPRRRRAVRPGGVRHPDRQAEDAPRPADRRADAVELGPHVRLQHAGRVGTFDDVPVRGGRVLRLVQRRRHRQLRRLPVELHEQPDRGRRRVERAGLHPDLHVRVPESNVGGAGADDRRRDVDVLHQVVGQGGGEAVGHQHRRAGRPQVGRGDAVAGIPVHARPRPRPGH